MAGQNFDINVTIQTSDNVVSIGHSLLGAANGILVRSTGRLQVHVRGGMVKFYQTLQPNAKAPASRKNNSIATKCLERC